MTEEFLLDHRCKGYPLHAAPCRPADLGSQLVSRYLSWKKAGVL
mgnify:CR=1 FL=1